MRRHPAAKFRTLDAREMTGIADGSFDAVVDKSCLDVFLPPLTASEDVAAEVAAEMQLEDASRMLHEVARVLRPGGPGLL